MSSVPLSRAQNQRSINNLADLLDTPQVIEAVAQSPRLAADLAAYPADDNKRWASTARPKGDTTQGGRTAVWYELPDDVYVESTRCIGELIYRLTKGRGGTIGFGFRTQHADAPEMAPPTWRYSGITTIDHRDIEIAVDRLWIDDEQMVVVYQLEVGDVVEY